MINRLSTEIKSFDCPYCGETIQCEIDLSVDEQYYVEDCQVCCQPIEFHLIVDEVEGLTQFEVKRQQD